MPRALSLAVVGAPYPNKDGSNRAFEIALCSPGDPVELRPEPKNRYDEHAVAVFSERGVQMGYVDSERAVQIGMLWRAGHELAAIFQAQTQWGAIIRIGVDEAPALPPASKPAPPEGSDPDSEFWPDPEWPDE